MKDYIEEMSKKHGRTAEEQISVGLAVEETLRGVLEWVEKQPVCFTEANEKETEYISKNDILDALNQSKVRKDDIDELFSDLELEEFRDSTVGKEQEL